MSECKNKECTREAYVLDKPYCSSMCCISDLERQLKEAREALSSIRGILPTVHSSDREIHEIINKVLKEKG